MKLNNIKYWTLAAILGANLVSCDDFLDRPAEDSYNVDNFYQNDEQCFQGVNPLYNSPWFDFQRGFFKVGEVLAGNYYWGSSPYLTFTVNGTDEDLINMSYSLWSVNAYANTIRERLQTAGGSEQTRNTCMGECLVWKAMAYFYLVRTFGAVPIVHSNSDDIAAGNYNEKYKVQIPDVYEYIVMTLEEAIRLLPESNSEGRIDQYTAKGLLAKVYLTKSGYGMSGSRNEDDLRQAAAYAKDVIDNSGRHLLADYSDVFRLANNFNEECLLSWHWSASSQHSQLSTHLLRLSDVYLIYAEAMIGNNGSTSDESAIDAFYQVRHRAISTYERPSVITWEDVWKERRLELACEGDRWYDYVRLSYYDPQRVINELTNQRRDVYYGLDDLYKTYYQTGSFTVNPDEHRYNPNAVKPNVTISSFTLPFPTEDVVFNPHLMEDPIHVDVRSEFSY